MFRLITTFCLLSLPGIFCTGSTDDSSLWLKETTLGGGYLDTQSPAEVSSASFVAGSSSDEITVSWINPTDADFAGVRIISSINASDLDGNVTELEVCTTCVSPLTLPYLNDTLTYYFKIFTFDQIGNTSAGITGSTQPAAASASTCTGVTDNSCLQLATFNLEWFDVSDSGAKKEGIASIIEDNDLDVIGLQEVDGAAALTDLVDNYLGGSSAWSFVVGDTGYSQNVAILFKNSLVSFSDAKELGNVATGGLIDETTESHWKFMRLPLYAKVTITNTGNWFHLVVVHFKAFSDSAACNKRRAQVEDVNAWLAGQTGDTVLMGDFNDEILGNGICGSTNTLAALENNANLNFITNSAVGWLRPSEYTQISYTSTIDHIMVNDNLLSRLHSVDVDHYKSDVIMHLNGTISDHHPAFVWLKE